ncbi:hypothetical protein HN011_000885 [Eciton burchellii]|nr:hypothetical protein HN011_000885 [Eciton burchellii]
MPAISRKFTSRHLHWSSHRVDSLDSGGAAGWPRPSRPRVNSAIDVAGFLSQEFLRRHGSTSKLCRKVRSADNLPLASTNRQDPRKGSKDEGIDGDRESFLKTSQEDKSEDLDPKRQGSIDSTPKDNTETSLLDSAHQQPSSRDSPVSSSSLVTKRFGSWRGGSHEYVRCPVRQPASMDERHVPSADCVLDVRVARRSIRERVTKNFLQRTLKNVESPNKSASARSMK